MSKDKSIKKQELGQKSELRKKQIKKLSKRDLKNLKGGGECKCGCHKQ